MKISQIIFATTTCALISYGSFSFAATKTTVKCPSVQEIRANVTKLDRVYRTPQEPADFGVNATEGVDPADAADAGSEGDVYSSTAFNSNNYPWYLLVKTGNPQANDSDLIQSARAKAQLVSKNSYTLNFDSESDHETLCAYAVPHETKYNANIYAVYRSAFAPTLTGLKFHQ